MRVDVAAPLPCLLLYLFSSLYSPSSPLSLSLSLLLYLFSLPSIPLSLPSWRFLSFLSRLVSSLSFFFVVCFYPLIPGCVYLVSFIFFFSLSFFHSSFIFFYFFFLLAGISWGFVCVYACVCVCVSVSFLFLKFPSVEYIFPVCVASPSLLSFPFHFLSFLVLSRRVLMFQSFPPLPPPCLSIPGSWRFVYVSVIY